MSVPWPYYQSKLLYTNMPCSWGTSMSRAYATYGKKEQCSLYSCFPLAILVLANAIYEDQDHSKHMSPTQLARALLKTVTGY